jgi:homotetrameric NADPH-dependent glutamate synthase
MNTSVLVIGGGIAGIQASVDLGDMGFKVYLVEKTPAIGGRMAQLDKTFPTNDCAMCMLSPKLVEAGRHPNVKIITQANVEKVEGEAGDFKITILKTPRYIIEDKCTGCGDCAEVCPVERPSVYEQGLTKRKAVYRPFMQAIPNIFTISKNERPPCTTTCPINNNAQGYIALIRQRHFKEALQLIREKNPLPSVCGRVCTHPCETECNRRDVDESIAIRALKRFVADYGLSSGGEEITSVPRTKKKTVAIVGSGPAGLTAAYDLIKMGYGVTVFESLPVAGGMLAVGIPGYRLPKDILEREIEVIRKLGVEIKLNTPIGEDLTIDDLWHQGHKAIFLAVGAHRSLKLNIPGEDLDGVYHGVSFLRDVNLGKGVQAGKKVAVIGGGNVAIDSARTALRLGAIEVLILYRRSRQEMLAAEEEIEAAENEGAGIHYLTAPIRILGDDGKVTAIECVRMELGEPDASGRRRPVPIEGSEFTIEVDMVIPSIGQAPDLSFLPKDSKFKFGRGGTFEVDPVSLATNVPGVFAGGDAVSGPAIVVEAMAAGRRASNSIDRYLRGENLRTGREGEFMTTTHPPLDIAISKVEKKPRQKMPMLPVEQRVGNFEEVELGFTEDTAVAEANRCLDCGICSECLECVRACKAEAINHSQQEETIELNVGAIVLATGFDSYDTSLLKEYGYGKIRNVISAMEYERMISASGPTAGELKRPSDGKIPKRLAFIQCVGSRDVKHKPYCSTVCCMYATKEAILANEHYADLRVFIFYTDLRAVGKGFQEYIKRAKKEYGVTYIRSRPGKVTEDPQTTNPIIWYEETTTREIKSMEVDLVVLCQALTPSHSFVEIASKLQIALDEYGFVYVPDKLFHPLDSNTPGIVACGFCRSPQDIPSSIIQASGAAARVAELLSSGD